MAVVVTQNFLPHNQGGEQGKGVSSSEYLSLIFTVRNKMSTLGHRASMLNGEIPLPAQPRGVLHAMSFICVLIKTIKELTAEKKKH
jgi:hypothetical protein